MGYECRSGNGRKNSGTFEWNNMGKRNKYSGFLRVKRDQLRGGTNRGVSVIDGFGDGVCINHWGKERNKKRYRE